MTVPGLANAELAAKPETRLCAWRMNSWNEEERIGSRDDITDIDWLLAQSWAKRLLDASRA